MYDRVSNLANRISQRAFGEPAVYIRDEVETELKALFDTQPVEVNGVISQALTAEVLAVDLPGEPRKGDKLRRGTKTYSVQPPQGSADGKVLTLILKE